MTIFSENRHYPLTHSQEMLLSGQLLSADSPMYNMAFAFEIKNKISLPHFQQAFTQTVKEVDAMRIIFVKEGEAWIQSVLTSVPYALGYVDTYHDGELLYKELQEKSKQVFELGKILFEAKLYKLSEEHYVFYLNQHHLITDAIGTTVQVEHLMKCYSAIISNIEDSTFQNELNSYTTFIKYENDQRHSPALKKSRDYWKALSENLGPPTNLLPFSGRSVCSNSERIEIELDVELEKKIDGVLLDPKFRCWTSDLTRFNIFTTALYALIHRISGQSEIAIGSPTHSRISEEFKKSPGIFIELFPHHIKIEAADTFPILYNKVRIATNNYLKHAKTGVSNPKIAKSFNVVLNYINTSFTWPEEMDIQSHWIHSGYADPAHQLRLQVQTFDQSRNTLLGFDLNTDIFKVKSREQVPAAFIRCLEALISKEDKNIDHLEIFENHTQVPPLDIEMPRDINLNELLDKVFKEHRDDIAIFSGEIKISYENLEKKVNKLSQFLIANGVKVGDRVALLLPRSVDYVVSVLACIKTGGVFIPVPINLPRGRIFGLIEDAKPALIITTSEFKSLLPRQDLSTIQLDIESAFIDAQKLSNETRPIITNECMAYLLYTSGSTGAGKGVLISHKALVHYLQWASKLYLTPGHHNIPFFTSVGFDLTITSLFLPFTTGGTMHVYPEKMYGPDLAFIDVIKENRVDFIKLTPTHISALADLDVSNSKLKTVIIGGENLRVDIADFVHNAISSDVKIFNEYGPTEATVGTIVFEYDGNLPKQFKSVPIGRPAPGIEYCIVDEYQNKVVSGGIGTLLLSGVQLANGYWQKPEIEKEKFIQINDKRWYNTGDKVSQNSEKYLRYHGRIDDQVKINGKRVEIAEIESAIGEYGDVKSVHVSIRTPKMENSKEAIIHCSKCGLPSNYPQATFDKNDVCNLCLEFDSYQDKVKKYFKTEADLKQLLKGIKGHAGAYDCIVLLSGGKDSTYALAQMKEIGFKILAFTLDNGYISEEAKDNVRRVVSTLDIDHVFSATESMNEIFVDSLLRHKNVCDGCFKTIYTLSIRLAEEKKIPFIVTGLSRGQFFETRLTEELFRSPDVDVEKIDAIILNARRSYHQVDDAVKKHLNTDVFNDDTLFDRVRFIDYYRYTDVSLDEMLEYLNDKLPWVRPSDTGRSTNCLINKAGIYVHKKEVSYSNYAFPYSWDVRVGHKTRDASLEEINEEIDEKEVLEILSEVGYLGAKRETENKILTAYVVGKKEVSKSELRKFISHKLPDYMLPKQIIQIPELPLTENGKVNENLLPQPDFTRLHVASTYLPPETEFEVLVHDIWSSVLNIEKIGIEDAFIDLGGDSLSGIRIMARISEALELELQINLIFQYPTISKLSRYIEEMITRLMGEIDDN